jgi:hypothetical protein
MGVNPTWANAYNNQGLGYLIQTILYPIGFAKFILVLLVLSGSMSTLPVLCSRVLKSQLADQ